MIQSCPFPCPSVLAFYLLFKHSPCLQNCLNHKYLHCCCSFRGEVSVVLYICKDTLCFYTRGACWEQISSWVLYSVHLHFLLIVFRLRIGFLSALQTYLCSLTLKYHLYIKVSFLQIFKFLKIYFCFVCGVYISHGAGCWRWEQHLHTPGGVNDVPIHKSYALCFITENAIWEWEQNNFGLKHILMQSHILFSPSYAYIAAESLFDKSAYVCVGGESELY